MAQLSIQLQSNEQRRPKNTKGLDFGCGGEEGHKENKKKKALCCFGQSALMLLNCFFVAKDNIY